jgi:DNA-binding FadR family transcriptional regulator
MPTKDRIVEEVHAAREAIARESDHDLDRIIAAACARQSAGDRRVVRLPPKKVPATKEA